LGVLLLRVALAVKPDDFHYGQKLKFQENTLQV
jgi:hypothetical protein